MDETSVMAGDLESASGKSPGIWCFLVSTGPVVLVPFFFFFSGPVNSSKEQDRRAKYNKRSRRKDEENGRRLV